MNQSSVPSLRQCATLNLAIFCLAALPIPAVADADNFSDCRMLTNGGLQAYDAECREFRVPVDYRDPDGASLSLFMAKVPALSKTPESEPIVLLAGGPGQSATEAYTMVAQSLERMHKTRDIWLIDQRGTGKSNGLRCDLPELAGMQAPEDDQVLLAAVAQCRDQLLADGAALEFFTTSDAVQDLENLRRQLGGHKLNLYGASYGTRVAIEYARRYPDSVRSVILDGVVPPQLALGQDHALVLDQAVELALASCLDYPACRERFGDPRLSLQALRTQLKAKPVTLSVRDPSTGEITEQQLTHEVLAQVVRLYVYGTESLSLLPLLLSEAQEGRYQPLLSQAFMIHKSMSEAINLGMALSVSCSEDAFRLRDDPQDIPRLLGQSLTRGIQVPCSIWPKRAPPPDFNEAWESDLPVLLMSGAWDPVTPPRYGDQVASTLGNARHLIVPQQGHIALRRGCMPRLAAEFVDTLDAGALDAQCLKTLRPAPFFIDFNGPTP